MTQLVAHDGMLDWRPIGNLNERDRHFWLCDYGRKDFLAETCVECRGPSEEEIRERVVV